MDTVISQEKYKLDFFDEPNDDEYIWRYLDVNKFLSFLIEQKLHFTRLDRFSDINEGASAKHLQINAINYGIKELGASKINETLMKLASNMVLSKDIKRNRKTHKVIQALTYSNSWFLGNRESMAMWSIYSTKESVAIKIKYKDLKSILLNYQFKLQQLENPYRISIGKVSYSDYTNYLAVIEAENKMIKTGFHKDLSYAHENEFRIIITKIAPRTAVNMLANKNSTKEEFSSVFGLENGISLIIENFKKCPFEVVFHPLANTWALKNLEILMEKLEIPFKCCQSEIQLK